MFDTTGIVEIFISRIDSRERNTRPLPCPVVNENGDIILPKTTTQERFAVCMFLTEKFDCMGADIVQATFSLDHGISTETRYYQWQCPCTLADKSGDEEEETTKKDSWVNHGSYELLQRVAFQDALLAPVNAEGWPLEAQERSQGSIIIALQRGRLELQAEPSGDAYYLFALAGLAGATTTITFDYSSRYRGPVELQSTTTFSSSSAPSLHLTRRPINFSCLGKHAMEDDDESTEESSPFAQGPQNKKPKLASSSDATETASEYRHPLSPYWSEDL